MCIVRVCLLCWSLLPNAVVSDGSPLHLSLFCPRTSFRLCEKFAVAQDPIPNPTPNFPSQVRSQAAQLFLCLLRFFAWLGGGCKEECRIEQNLLSAKLPSSLLPATGNLGMWASQNAKK